MKNRNFLTPMTIMKESVRNVTANLAVIGPRQAKFLCRRRSLGYVPPSLVHRKLITGIVRLLRRTAP